MNNSFESITGGKWWKIDFHLHTPGSYDYGHGDENQANTTPDEFLQCCMDKQLDCIIVTDHDTLKWVPKLRQALSSMKEAATENFRNIVIFPGIEINVQGNVHLLGIFDPEADYEDVLASIPALIGVNKYTQTTDKSINEVIDIIHQNNGIAIPAHVDGPCGLLNDKTAPSVAKSALQTKNLLALEVLSRDFQNGLYSDSKLKLAHVLGSDSHSTDTIGDRYTWVKMGEANIEALRLALYDAQDGSHRSIEIDKNPNDITGRTYIKELVIDQGACIGRKAPYTIRFSPWLNSLIGGRGSGKSTILNFLRLVLNREFELPDDLRKNFDNFAKIPANRNDLGLLRERTVITLIMVVDGVEYTLRWTGNEILEQLDGSFIASSNVVERFPVNIFSQKQLFNMTNNPRLLFEYLDSEWNAKLWNEKLDDTKKRYFNCCKKIRLLSQQQEKRKDLSTQLRDLEKKIKIFETETTKLVLENRSHLNSCKAKVEEYINAFQPFLSWLAAYDQNMLPSNSISLDFLDNESLSVLQDWSNRIFSVKAQIESIVEQSTSVILSADSLFEKLKLYNLILQNNQEMKELIAELKQAGIDNIGLYEGLLRDKEQVEKQLSQIADASQAIEAVEAEAKAILFELNELIKERYSERQKVITRWNSFGHLKISLGIFQDLEQNESEFRKIIRRDSSFDSDILSRDPDSNDPVGGFIFKTCVESVGGQPDIDSAIARLQEEKNMLFNLDSQYTKRFRSYLERTYTSFDDTIERLSVWIPEDTLSLQIKIGKKYKSVDVGSPGQRTSAILSLIFAISKAPIIIDQPEDDLDTRNITDIVVDSINRIKSNQQIILVTHNPNVVVNTNSEQVVQLDYQNGQIINVCSGALQSHDVRDAICNVMEGGKEALEKRYYRIFKALSKD